MKRLGVVSLSLTLVLCFASAGWATRIYGATSLDNQLGNADALIDLGTDLNGNAVGDTLQFNVGRSGHGVITFSAECSVEGDVADWVSIDIIVNGSTIGQSDNTDDAFCSGNETATDDDGWVVASMTVPYEFSPGNVDLQVRVTLQGNATEWWIGDTGISVILQKR